MKKKSLINEVRQLQKIAGLLKEDLDLDDNPFQAVNFDKLVSTTANNLQIEDDQFRIKLIKFLGKVSTYLSRIFKNLDEPLNTPGFLTDYIEDFSSDYDDSFSDEENYEFNNNWFGLILTSVVNNKKLFKTTRDYINYFDTLAKTIRKSDDDIQSKDDPFNKIEKEIEEKVKYYYEDSDPTPEEIKKLVNIYKEEMKNAGTTDVEDFFLDLEDSSDPDAFVELSDLDKYEGY
jgi:phage regulator Rha-like protein